LAAVVLVFVGLTAGCGSKAAITPTAAQALGDQVAAVRLAASQQDPAGARLALDQLRATLSQLEQGGQVSATRAGAILSDVAAVQDQLSALPTPTTAAPATSAPPGDGQGHDHGKGGGGGGGD
jgi:hypothetical protein